MRLRQPFAPFMEEKGAFFLNVIGSPISPSFGQIHYSSLGSSLCSCKHAMGQPFFLGKTCLNLPIWLSVTPSESTNSHNHTEYSRYLKRNQDFRPQVYCWGIREFQTSNSITQAAPKNLQAVPSGEPVSLIPHLIRTRNTLELGNITERFLSIWKIFGELSDLQDKAKKEGILKNEAEEGPKMINDESFAVGN